MPALSDVEKKLLGPIISPFERSGKTAEQKILKDGETEEFQEFVHDAIDDHKPKYYVELTAREIEVYIKRKGRYRDKCFLWIIDEVSIKMIRETTRNVLRNPDYVCHTNLTAGGAAFVGGELFFGEDGKIYVNYFSDRYGNPNEVQWRTVLNYFRKVGYTNVVDILELLLEEA